MATAFRRCLLQVSRKLNQHRRQIHAKSSTRTVLQVAATCGCVTGAALTYHLLFKDGKRSIPAPIVYAKKAKKKQEEDIKKPQKTHRELRYLEFASIEHDGTPYMTPQDFLESVTEEEPRARTGRLRLRKEDVDRYLKVTPPRWRGSSKLFRTLHDKGLISYTEYLFLLCVLTKPHSGFRIAFNMFDTDGDQRVDKKEFLVLEQVIRQTEQAKLEDVTLPKRRQLRSYLVGFGEKGDEEEVSNSEQQAPTKEKGETDVSTTADTTIMVHYFGRKGNDVLKYEDFHRFMENLQTEVLELEFSEFAKGMPSITEEEFAEILLRYTTLSDDEHDEYLERLRERIPHSHGIGFKDFKQFCQFLNSLDDFQIAMRMYTIADQPISQGEFKRAVTVCTGQALDPHVVNTVFQLFDIDGDGHLSQNEFISIMKDRLYRGYRTPAEHSSWENFKTCVKNEMKKQ